MDSLTGVGDDQETQTLTTSDGRTLAFIETGDPAGAPLFLLHGTPGCRLSGRHPDPSQVAEAGLRLVTYDRPGYGISTRHRGRRVVDCVADVAAIADSLLIERFSVCGGSGGGPHALAVAARLPERVVAARCDVGVAPYCADGLDWWEGMDKSNVREVRWALEGEERLSDELEREVAGYLERLDEDPVAVLSDIELSHSDRAVLQAPDVRRLLGASTREMFAQGATGWVDDDLAFIGPWGFDVGEIEVPVDVRYGATDVLVPPGHGEWLGAHIRDANVIVDEDGGHLSTPDQHLERLRAFVAR